MPHGLALGKQGQRIRATEGWRNAKKKAQTPMRGARAQTYALPTNTTNRNIDVSRKISVASRINMNARRAHNHHALLALRLELVHDTSLS